MTVGTIAYNQMSLWDNLAVDAEPPVADIQTWKLAGTRLTTVTAEPTAPERPLAPLVRAGADLRP
jgi:hypothetical protein